MIPLTPFGLLTPFSKTYGEGKITGKYENKEKLGYGIIMFGKIQSNFVKESISEFDLRKLSIFSLK